MNLIKINKKWTLRKISQLFLDEKTSNFHKKFKGLVPKNKNFLILVLRMHEVMIVFMVSFFSIKMDGNCYQR